MDRAKLMAPYKEAIIEAAERFGHDPWILCGIIERESTWRNIIGDRGFGHGLMQIDSNTRNGNTQWCEDWVAQGMDPTANILKGAAILDSKWRFLAPKVNLYGWEMLRAVIAAYNTGEGNVLRSIRAGRDVDSTTTGGDYSADVLRRSAHYKEYF
jgi:soluble lytic murein transglycosylase-like protein